MYFFVKEKAGRTTILLLCFCRKLGHEENSKIDSCNKEAAGDPDFISFLLKRFQAKRKCEVLHDIVLFSLEISPLSCL